MICHSVLLTALGLSLQAQDTLQYDALIYGKITSTDTASVASIASMPIGSVIIEVTGPNLTPRQQTGDDNGAYSLSNLAAGTYTLRFSRAGFITLVLEVRVTEHSSVHLDVTLDRAPAMLQTIKVVASDAGRRFSATVPSTGAYRPWHIEGARMKNLPSLDFPDVIRAVGTSPDATAGPESNAGMHVQGGAANHSSLLIDGIPLYNAIHAGDHPSAIDPDAVADITSYTEPRASTGGSLSGVIEVNTRAALPDSQHVVTSIWPTGVRAITQMQFTGGSVMIGARRNYARPMERDTREPVAFRPNDAFATASIFAAGGSLTGLMMSSSDAVSFDADPLNVPLNSQIANRFNWTSDARGLTYSRAAPSGFSMAARVWQSGTSIGAYWAPLSGSSMRMANHFTQTAASTNMSWSGTRSVTSIGVSIERLRGAYSVSDTLTADADILLGVNSHLRVESAFAEYSRDIGRFSATVGERVAVVGGTQAFFEPRFAIAVPLADGINLSAAFARTHQFTQSLYNDESAVDAMASLDVPVVAGTSGVPVASSISGSLQLEWSIGASTLITARSYARQFDGLVLAGPSGGDPFATRAFTLGRGEAYGGSLGLRAQFGRLDVQSVYSMSSVSREWTGERAYRPNFAPNNSFLLSAGFAAGENTVLRASGFMSAIRSTSPLVGAVAWGWQDVLASQREVSGSPQYSPSALGLGQLEPYVRIDVGVRHAFTLKGRFHASLFANVDNLLDRENAAGLVEDPSGTGTRALGMMPRSLSFGIGLGF